MINHNNSEKKSKYIQSTPIESLNSIKDYNMCMQDTSRGYNGDYDRLIDSLILFNHNDTNDKKEENSCQVKWPDGWSEILIPTNKDEPLDNEYEESIFHDDTYIDEHWYCYIPLETSTNIKAYNTFDEETTLELLFNPKTHFEKNSSTIKIYLDLFFKPFLNFKHPNLKLNNIDFNKPERSIDMIDVKRVFPPIGPPII